MKIYSFVRISKKGGREHKNKGTQFFHILIAAMLFLMAQRLYVHGGWTEYTNVFHEEQDYIQWMDYNVTLAVMEKAYQYDIESYQTDVELNWIELIAYSAAKNWGRFDKTNLNSIDDVAGRLKQGEKMADITEDMELYSYYLECYKAVLAGFVGEYDVLETDPEHPESQAVTRKYGLRVFSPIAAGYNYSHYRDFGNSRSYGYQRRHLGNDLMGSVGTPIIAIEDGYVEALGWNQYGGWRIGIRSLDGKRYYYYAHLQKDHPYRKDLEEGARVQAGDVIGYLGMTGYSATENVNNITTPHLHLGLQIIFDESQKDGTNQIWIDVYNIVEFLSRNKMPAQWDGDSGEFNSGIQIQTIPND